MNTYNPEVYKIQNPYQMPVNNIMIQNLIALDIPHPTITSHFPPEILDSISRQNQIDLNY